MRTQTNVDRGIDVVSNPAHFAAGERLPNDFDITQPVDDDGEDDIDRPQVGLPH